MESYPEVIALEEPPPRRKGWTVLAWAVIVLGAATVIGIRYLPGEEEKAEATSDRLSVLLLELQGRYFIGAMNLLGPAGGNLANELDKLNRGSVDQRLAFMTLSGETAGAGPALQRLQAFDDLCRQHNVVLSADQARLRDILGRLYRDYDQRKFSAPSLTDDDRAFLNGQLGWFGTLALHPRQSEDTAGRADALRPAYVTFGVLISAICLAGLATLVGFCAAVLFVVLASQGALTWRFKAGADHAGVYAETFALWLIGYFSLTLLAGFGLSSMAPLARAGAAMIASLSVLAWPVLRGIPWHQVRRDIGLTCGNPFVEIGAGIATYVMTLPLVALGVAMTIVMLLVQQHLVSQVAGGNEDFSSAAGPAHPIIQYLADGAWLSRLQIFVLASVIAPITEETMFRGFLHRSCRELTAGWGRVASALASTTVVSFLFASIHPQGLIAIPPLMFMAFGFSLMREWRESLLPSMFAHGMSNGMVMTVAMIALS